MARPALIAVHAPIADYALLSDSQGAALVSRSGSIDWACLPRFDSPAIFARILDPDAGHWRLAPPETGEVTRRYVDGTMVLRTEFHTRAGKVATGRHRSPSLARHARAPAHAARSGARR